MNISPRKIVIDTSLAIDLYAAPNESLASIAEEVTRLIMQGVVEAYAPKLLIIEITGVLSRYLSEEELNLVLDTLPPIKPKPRTLSNTKILITNTSTQPRKANSNPTTPHVGTSISSIAKT